VRHKHLLIYLLVLFVVAAGCSKKKKETAQLPDPWIEVFLTPGYEPLPGIKVVVMDRETNTPVMAPALTDTNGRATFPGLPTGHYSLLAYGGSAFAVVDLPSRWDQAIGKSGGMAEGPLSPFEKTAPLPLPPSILMRRLTTPGDLPRIAGRILDAATGAPLDGAFVGVSPTLTGYTGLTSFKDDVTAADGSFTVHEIAFGRDPITGNFFQLEPLLVSRAGYRPRIWTHNMANGDDNLDIRNRRIELTPLSAEDTGALRGRMLLNGVGAAGVVVGLGGGEMYTPEKSGPGLPGQLTVTDSEGKFLFTGLAAGQYFVQGGFQPNDGYYQTKAGGSGRHLVTRDETTNAGDTTLLHEIDLTYPPNGREYFGAEWITALQWSPVEGAALYKVTFAGLVGQTDEPSISLPDDLELPPGAYPWGVTAHDADGTLIGSNEVAGLFYIVAEAAGN